MLRINQIKLPANHTKEQLEKKIYQAVPKEFVESYHIWKQSIDARKKDNICYVYSVDIKVTSESKTLKHDKRYQIQKVNTKSYKIPKAVKEYEHAPVIAGFGPAGIFCGLVLARAGLNPVILERGASVDERQEDVKKFWETGVLNTESNVQFGEGGAGTFSDGKLNTLVKDKFGRNRFVLETFVEYGAPEEILYEAKPHIGTDLLCKVISNIREDIISLGGKVCFHSKVTDFVVKDNHITEVVINDAETIPCDVLVLALGHSARDTFEMLHKKQLEMTPKAFAMGVRVEHPRKFINQSQYGNDYEKYHLPTASYKLTYHTKEERSVYSFCMCPGGFVVNASSEEGRLTVNGMSNHDRMGQNSNSAIIVNVTPDDFYGQGPLAGVEFQRYWEEKAFAVGKGKIPVQRLEDFNENKESTKFGTITPDTKGETSFANVRDCLPDFVSEGIEEGMKAFDLKIHGFANPDTLLLGIEARTSSPLRIERDESMQSQIRGIYPCGEGAGYAGGITSAAMDGIKTAENIL